MSTVHKTVHTFEPESIQTPTPEPEDRCLTTRAATIIEYSVYILLFVCLILVIIAGIWKYTQIGAGQYVPVRGRITPNFRKDSNPFIG